MPASDRDASDRAGRAGITPVVILVTDPRYDLERTSTVIRTAAKSLGEHRLLVQLRDKVSGPEALQATADALRAVTREAGALFVVNGSLLVAERAGADGVHVPGSSAPTTSELRLARRRSEQALGRRAFITTPAHDDDDVRRAIDDDATAVLVSPIFATPGKSSSRGLDAIARARGIVDAARRTPPLLVYALGGVTAANAAACAQAGADGVAAIRALYDDAAAAGALGAPF